MNHNIPISYKLIITETPTDEFKPTIITEYIMVDCHVYNLLEQHKWFSKMVKPTTFVSSEQQFPYETITITITPLERGETQPPKTEHMTSKNVVRHLQHIDNIKPSELNERTGASVSIVTLRWLLSYSNRVYHTTYDVANIIFREHFMVVPTDPADFSATLFLSSNIVVACDTVHAKIMTHQNGRDNEAQQS